MKWIIQKDWSSDDTDLKWSSALDKYGSKYEIYKYKAFMNVKDIEKDFAELKEPSLCCGSIQFISKVQKSNNPYLMTYCDFNYLKCSYYYPIYKDLLLNVPYVFTRWGDLQETGFSGLRFIRPDSPKKPFVGCVTDFDHLTQDIGQSIINIDNNTRILLTMPKDIEREWRFFVSYGCVITGSQYHLNGELNIEEGYDIEASKIAIQASYRLSTLIPIITIDVCKTYGGEYKIVELNGFSCSGVYACDLNLVVKYIEGMFK